MFQKEKKQIESPISGTKFTICKLPAIEGRLLVKDYIEYNLPRIGNRLAAKEAALKLLSYVEVDLEDGTSVALSSNELINNHIKDTDEFAWLETQMVEYNFSFLGKINIAPLIIYVLKTLHQVFSGIGNSNQSSGSSLVKG